LVSCRNTTTAAIEPATAPTTTAARSGKDGPRRVRWPRSCRPAIPPPRFDPPALSSTPSPAAPTIERLRLSRQSSPPNAEYSGRLDISGRKRRCWKVRGVAFLEGGAVAVRDSKDPSGPAVLFTAAEWDAFSAGMTDGEFVRP
jgi:hypothetical protein